MITAVIAGHLILQKYIVILKSELIEWPKSSQTIVLLQVK